MSTVINSVPVPNFAKVELLSKTSAKLCRICNISTLPSSSSERWAETGSAPTNVELIFCSPPICLELWSGGSGWTWFSPFPDESSGRTRFFFCGSGCFLFHVLPSLVVRWGTLLCQLFQSLVGFWWNRTSNVGSGGDVPIKAWKWRPVEFTETACIWQPLQEAHYWLPWKAQKPEVK